MEQLAQPVRLQYLGLLGLERLVGMGSVLGDAVSSDHGDQHAAAAGGAEPDLRDPGARPAGRDRHSGRDRASRHRVTQQAAAVSGAHDALARPQRTRAECGIWCQAVDEFEWWRVGAAAEQSLAEQQWSLAGQAEQRDRGSDDHPSRRDRRDPSGGGAAGLPAPDAGCHAAQCAGRGEPRVEDRGEPAAAAGVPLAARAARAGRAPPGTGAVDRVVGAVAAAGTCAVAEPAPRDAVAVHQVGTAVAAEHTLAVGRPLFAVLGWQRPFGTEPVTEPRPR